MKTINDYAELVKAEHALNKTIAPVEDGANIAGSYTSGKQFIRGGVLYTALTTIAANTAWSSLTLDTDYELADDITSQLASLNQTLTNKTDGIVANINANGSKNILPFDLAECIALNTSGTWSGNKHSARGIELTYNDDGTVTLDGTTTDAGGDQYAEFELESGKTYIYSIGNPFNLSATAGSNLQGYNGTSWVTLVNIYDTGKEAEFTTSDTYSKYRVNINANNGVTFSNFTIKPMICSNSDYALSSDYVPYAKTNRELTEIAEILADKGFLNVPNGENAPNINPDNHKTVGLWRYKINNVDYYGFSFIFNKDWVCQIRTQTRGTYLQYRIFNNTSWSEWKYLGDCTHRIYRGATSGSETAKSKTFTVMDGYIYHVYGYYSTNYTHKMFTYHGSVVREFDLEQSGTVDCCTVSIDGQNVTVSSAAQRYAQIQVFETQGAWAGESD